eukprot:6778737-Prymnesium_polylepis.1
MKYRALFFICMWGASLIHAFLAPCPRRYARTHTHAHARTPCYTERRWAVTTVTRPSSPTSQQFATLPVCRIGNARKHNVRVLRH